MNYNSIFKKYAELQKEYQNQRNTMYEKESISKSLEIQNEDINRMMKDILEKEEELKKIKEENDGLKDKIEKNDIAFKLKDNDIRIFRIQLDKLKNEKTNLSKENNELKIQIKNLEEEINKNNEKIKILNERHKKEISSIEKNFKNLQNQNTQSDSILNDLKEKMEQLAG